MYIGGAWWWTHGFLVTAEVDCKIGDVTAIIEGRGWFGRGCCYEGLGLHGGVGAWFRFVYGLGGVGLGLGSGLDLSMVFFLEGAVSPFMFGVYMLHSSQFPIPPGHQILY